MSRGRRLRAVVCGTTFGQFYLAALAALPEEFELVGVLAKGSRRSVECAGRFGVPLFTREEDLPEIDLACVVLRSAVLGGAGTDLAMRLLGRGVHVLQEQPVHHDDLAACLREARRRGVHYRVGDLYARLPAVRRFTTAARALLARQPAAYVDAACSVQVAFPLLHILGDALGTVRPWGISAADGADGPFSVLTGQIGGAPLTVRVHNQVDPDDPDNHLHLLHRAAIGTAGGNLTLCDTHGPVAWSPRLHIPAEAKNRFDFAGPGTGHLEEPSTTLLGPAEQPTYRRALADLWPAAIGADLLALRADALGEARETRPGQYQLTLCRMWHDVTSHLGYPALRPRQVHQPVAVADLIAAVGVEPVPAARRDTPATLHGAIAQAVTSAQVQVRGITIGQVRSFVERLDDAVLSSMLRTLCAHGLADSGRSASQILTGARVAPAHHWLIERWLQTLVEHGLVERDGELFRATEQIDAAATTRAWDLAAESWTGRLGPPEFIDYLRRNAEHLPQLMSGEQQAALLLFPEGRSTLADSVYRDTATARYLNTAVAATVRAIAAAHPGPGPLRVLEAGAGTGATTEAVAGALGRDDPRVDYLFTDVSEFFLTSARKRFARQPWIRFGRYDIDQDPRAQGHAPGSAHLVIAAGVLNNARNIDVSVRRLVELLPPGGWLLITEPAREHLEILISQAFMMTVPRDARRASGTTFLSRRQWLDVLGDAGLCDTLTLPGEDHPLAPLGQRLFASRTPPC